MRIEIKVDHPFVDTNARVAEVLARVLEIVNARRVGVVSADLRLDGEVVGHLYLSEEEAL